MAQTPTYDFAIIGAGIAGASVAARLADGASVLLLEMETQPGYHTTGRSAAMFAPVYGPSQIRALTRASTAFFATPPAGFADAPLLSPRDVVMIARRDQTASLDAFMKELGEEDGISRIDGETVQKLLPVLRAGYAVGGVLDSSGSDIDVNGSHQGFLRQFKKLGGTLQASAEVTGLRRDKGVWTLSTKSDSYTAATVINGAGAWADQLGRLAGAEPIGLVPKRRTAMLIQAPDGLALESHPLAVDIDEDFYMKPDAGRLLISPANEDPMDPCDVQPDEFDIAYCIDRIETAFDMKVRSIETRWAGLRSFVADKVPVVGFSNQVDGFFWLAGQGGYGIQTSPALSQLAATLARGEAPPQDILDFGVDPAALAPGRAGLNP